jgi:hypothetical protein
MTILVLSQIEKLDFRTSSSFFFCPKILDSDPFLRNSPAEELLALFKAML